MWYRCDVNDENRTLRQGPVRSYRNHTRHVQGSLFTERSHLAIINQLKYGNKNPKTKLDNNFVLFLCRVFIGNAIVCDDDDGKDQTIDTTIGKTGDVLVTYNNYQAFAEFVVIFKVEKRNEKEE